MSKPAGKGGTKDRKVALLVTPQNLGKSWADVLNIQFIDKTAGDIRLTNNRVTPQLIKQNFTSLPVDAGYAFNYFVKEAIEQKQYELELNFENKGAGISKKQFITNGLLRYFHNAFMAVKPYSPLLKFYIKIVKGNNSVSNTPVSFSSFKPVLSFELQQVGDRINILTTVHIQDFTGDSLDFQRFDFFLVSKYEIFILSYNDYQTINFVEATNGKAYNEKDIKQAIATLEENYKVKRNGFFVKKQVDVAPVSRIFLSELNNAFLMLTPQWVYDGLVVEGPFKSFQPVKTSGEEIIIERNKEAEEALLKLIVALHPNFATQRNGYYYVSFAEAQKKQWFLKAYHHLLQQEIELSGMDMLSHFRYSPHRIATTQSIESEAGNKLSINLDVRFGEEKLNLVELQKMILSGQKAVLLKDGSLGILNDEWLQQYGHVIRHGRISTNGLLEVSKFMVVSLNQGEEERSLFKATLKEQWWSRWQQWQNTDTQLYDVPTTVFATLRPYQQKGFEWLTLLSEIGAGCCLADDMGLGKTLQTICFLARYQMLHPGMVNLVVAPASLLYNWQQEIQKFAPVLRTIVYHGNSRNATDIDPDKCDVLITSYGTLRSDAETLLQYNYGLAVLDESHNIKNPSAQVTGVVQQLNALVRIALSGTPVINNTFDLYSQLSYSLPGMFGSREFFKKEYADPIDRFQDEEKIKTLQKLTAPFILRRTKEQVATDLPAKTESILWCTMGTEQQNLYNEIQEQVKSNLFTGIQKDGLGKSKLAVIQGLLKLRQICNSPMLLPEEERQNISRSVKTDVLMDELNNLLEKHKVLVFSQFTTMLNLLQAECNKQSIAHYRLDGQTPLPKRAEMVNAFQQDDCSTNLFLISLKAGNTGLTLTAADYVFLFDPYWNRATEQQAIDRTHRIGQNKSVFAYKIICKNTIEERIIQLQNRKQKIADDLISEDDGFIKSLTEEDLKFLFG